MLTSKEARFTSTSTAAYAYSRRARDLHLLQRLDETLALQHLLFTVLLASVCQQQRSQSALAEWMGRSVVQIVDAARPARLARSLPRML